MDPSLNPALRDAYHAHTEHSEVHPNLAVQEQLDKLTLAWQSGLITLHEYLEQLGLLPVL